jgi:hypothetical protein
VAREQEVCFITREYRHTKRLKLVVEMKRDVRTLKLMEVVGGCLSLWS